MPQARKTRTLYERPTRILRPEPARVRPLTSIPYRARRRRRRITPYLIVGSGFLYFAVCIVLCGMFLAWVINNGKSLPANIEIGSTGPYNLEGSPTIDADFINKVLDHYDSPAAGKGKAMYDLGVKYHIDPTYALAFFMHESSFGKLGVARVTHSLGNIRTTEGYDDYQGYRKYKTWEAGFEDWYKLIRNLYLDQWQLATVDQIIPRYAPNYDNNDETAYINFVEHAVDTWRHGVVTVS